jgi:excisionase family DNA binding protein
MIDYILSPVPFADLEGIVARAIKVEFDAIRKDENVPDPDELLTRRQAATFLGLSLPTLHDYTTRGIVTAYRLGSRVRYKKGDLLNCLLKVQTVKHRAA